ncbi:MAG TPA: universal stress protein [Bacteroidales bacterium]|jgi:nucleotide-binding universal stress UspA family protein|nr:universal stress protein [Bacteroidales bacterium]HNZ42311.1 universal stress protein [Bacteroidales bacterium]HPI29481.1 universal stress protein [Bacteroidales bacterium]
MKNKIIVPTDLTPIAGQAIKQAVAIALKTNFGLTLLHVLTEKAESKEEVTKKLLAEAENIYSHSGIRCDILVREGSIFDIIPYEACERNYDLMVIGTHGIKGIKQMLFGANILKLAEKICIPLLVVQEKSQAIKSFKKIVLPVGSHDTFNDAVEAVLFFAVVFDAEVHLYSIRKNGFDWPDSLINNIENAVRRFESRGIQLVRVKEDQNVYSLGYAKQTLKYAQSVGADLICTMSVPSKEYYYFADSDKENLLLNEYHIPILCAGGGKTEK